VGVLTVIDRYGLWEETVVFDVLMPSALQCQPEARSARVVNCVSGVCD